MGPWIWPNHIIGSKIFNSSKNPSNASLDCPIVPCLRWLQASFFHWPLFIAGQAFSLANFHGRPGFFIGHFSLQAWLFHCRPGLLIDCFSLQASFFHWPLFIPGQAFHRLLFIVGQAFSLATFHCRPGLSIDHFPLQASFFHWLLFIAGQPFSLAAVRVHPMGHQESGHMTSCLKG